MTTTTNSFFQKSNTSVAIIGILSTAIVGLLFLLWGQQIVEPASIYKSVLLGFFLQLTIWKLNETNSDLSFSLLGSFILMLLLSFLPGSVFILMLAVAGLGFLFLKNIFKRTNSLTSSFVFSISLGVIILLSTSEKVGEVLAPERIRQFALNSDSLFHIVLSAFFRNYHTFTTGLHGLVPLKYHILSHIFYGRSAALLQVEQYEVYAYVNFIAFAPLLVTTWLSALTDVCRKNSSLTPLLFIVIGGPLGLYLGHHWYSHFISESYLLSLIFLAGFMPIVNRLAKDEEPSTSFYALAFCYILCMLFAKISTGLVAGCVFVYLIFEQKRFSFIKTTLPAFFTAVILLFGYWGTKYPDIPGHKASFAWGWFQQEYSNNKQLLYFLFNHFPYVFFLAPILLGILCSKELTPYLRRWVIATGICALIGFLGLNIMLSSSGYYFSNIHAFFILPLVAMVLDSEANIFICFLKSFKEPITRKNFALLIVGFVLTLFIFKEVNSALVIILFLSLGVFYRKNIQSFLSQQSVQDLFKNTLAMFVLLNMVIFAVKLAPMYTRNLIEAKETLLQHEDFRNPYINLFAQIKKDPDTKTMVYIPKTEGQFWNNDGGAVRIKQEQCMDMPLYIPMLTEKPVLFGLPDKGINCYTFHRGYELYSAEDYEKSRAANYDDQTLCAETLRLGFQSFYRVTESGGAIKHACN